MDAANSSGGVPTGASSGRSYLDKLITTARLRHLKTVRDDHTVVFTAIGNNMIQRNYVGLSGVNPGIKLTLFRENVEDVIVVCLVDDKEIKVNCHIDKAGVLQMTSK